MANYTNFRQLVKAAALSFLTFALTATGFSAPAAAAGCNQNLVNGVYQIYDIVGVQEMIACSFTDRDFELMNDIDASAYTTPMTGALTANLNGNGFEIHSISLDISGKYYGGFWEQIVNSNIYNITFSGQMYLDAELSGFLAAAVITSTIEDVTFNIDVDGTKWIGGIASQFVSSTILNVNVNPLNENSAIKSSSGYLGGFASYVSQSDFTGCTQNVDVIATGPDVSAAGGFVGHVQTGSVFDTIDVTADVSSSGSYVGGIIGKINGNPELTEIISSNSSGEVTGDGYVGGLVGYGTKLNIRESLSTATVAGKQNVGGLVGFWQVAESDAINESAYVGAASDVEVETNPDATNLGGLVGYADFSYGQNLTVQNSHVVATLSSVYSLGGLVGDMNTQGATIVLTNFYSRLKLPYVDYVHSQGAHPISGSTANPNTKITATDVFYDYSAIDGDFSGVVAIPGVTAVDTQQLKDPNTYSSTSWDFFGVWNIYQDVLDGLPSLMLLEADYPEINLQLNECTLELDGDMYVIDGVSDLLGIPNCDSQPGQQKFIMYSDIDLGNIAFEPLPAFSGILFGNGYTIDNLFLETPNELDQIGLFSSINGGKVSSLTIRGSADTSAEFVGLLAGEISDSELNLISVYSDIDSNADEAKVGSVAGSIQNSVIDGIFTEDLGDSMSIESYGGFVGGVTGFSYRNTFENISSVGSLRTSALSQFNDLGGITGFELGESSYENVTHSADIYGESQGSDFFGGIIGSVADVGNPTPTVISDCAVSGIITGNGYLGGLVGGASRLKISDCASSVEIFGRAAKIGGLVGMWTPIGNNSNPDSVLRSFFDGSIYAHNNASISMVGGLIGSVESGDDRFVVIEDAYAVANLVGVTSSRGGLIGYIDGSAYTPAVSVTTSFVSTNCSQDGSHPVFGSAIGKVLAEDVYWDSSICDPGTIWETNRVEGTVTGAPKKNLQRIANFKSAQFDFEDIWMIDQQLNFGLPTLRGVWNNPEQPDNPAPACVAKSVPALLFASNSTKLSTAMKRKLNQYATELEASGCLGVKVVGYASKKELKKGKKATTWQKALGANRAKVIKSYLLTRFKNADIQVSIAASSKGATKLAKKETSKANIAKNRRVLISFS